MKKYTFKEAMSEEFMKALDEFFDSPMEAMFDFRERHDHTYTVTIKGLSYKDAQEIMEIGLECGKTSGIRMEGEY